MHLQLAIQAGRYDLSNAPGRFELKSGQSRSHSIHQYDSSPAVRPSAGAHLRGLPEQNRKPKIYCLAHKILLLHITFRCAIDADQGLLGTYRPELFKDSRV